MTVFSLSGLPRDSKYLPSPSTRGLTFLILLGFATIFCGKLLPSGVHGCKLKRLKLKL